MSLRGYKENLIAENLIAPPHPLLASKGRGANRAARLEWENARDC